MKINSGIKMLDEVLEGTMNDKEIKSFNEYCKKLDKAARKEPFMICSKELQEELNKWFIIHKKNQNGDNIPQMLP